MSDVIEINWTMLLLFGLIVVVGTVFMVKSTVGSCYKSPEFPQKTNKKSL